MKLPFLLTLENESLIANEIDDVNKERMIFNEIFEQVLLKKEDSLIVSRNEKKGNQVAYSYQF